MRKRRVKVSTASGLIVMLGGQLEHAVRVFHQSWFPPRSVTICLFMNADLCWLDVGGISGHLTGTACATQV